MSEKVSISKQVFEKQQYRQVIDTSFTQLTVTAGASTAPAAPTPTVEEFFQSYSDLFFQIPKEGTTNSHQYLVEQSGEYIGGQAVNQDIIALQQEITNLREENLQLQEQLLNLSRGNG